MHLQFKVTGRVQGVFFRRWTITRAQEAGLHGWVCNASDGSVVGHVQGASEKAVTDFAASLQHGPPDAKVDKVETKQLEEDPELDKKEFGLRKEGQT